MSRFLVPWRNFFLKATDASSEYCEAAGLMALSSVTLSRRTLDVGRGVRPNLFMMLVGDSSVARKSTSVTFAKAILEQVEESRIGPRDYTIEGLLRWMNAEKDPSTGKTRNKVTLFAEEFGADLARFAAYGPTATADFCSLYDGESFEKARAGSAPLRVEKPMVNVFAASAYQMLQMYLKTQDWLSGYMMRFCYVAPQSNRPRQLLPPQWPKQEFDRATVALKVLRDDLARKFMKMGFEPAAATMFRQWAGAVESYALNSQSYQSIDFIYTGRFVTNVQKIALLYQVDDDPTAPIGTAAVKTAIDFASAVMWPSFKHVVGKTTGDTFESLATSIISAVTTAPNKQLSKADLYALFPAPLSRKVVDHLLWAQKFVLTKNGAQELLRGS